MLSLLKRHFALSIFLFACAAATAKAQDPSVTPQTQTGLSPFASVDASQIDNIYLGTGNLYVNIPLLSYPELGSSKLDFRLVYGGNKWQRYCTKQQESGGVKYICSWLPLGATGVTLGDNVTYQGKITPPGAIIECYLATCDSHVVTDPGFTQHAMGVLSTTTSHDTLIAEDGSGIRYDIYKTPGARSTAVMTSADGHLHADLQNTAPLTTPTILDQDTAGHTIAVVQSSSTYTMTDALGRTFTFTALPGDASPRGYLFGAPGTATTDTSYCSGPRPIAAAYLWNVPSVNGGTEPIKACYVSVTVSTHFNYGTTSEYSGALSKLQCIVLPNHTTWTFEYDSRNAGDASAVNYGELTTIIMPTGGQISYQWASSPDGDATTPEGTVRRYITSRTLMVNGVSSERTYAFQFPTGLNNPSTTTVTEPTGDYSVHTFAFGGEYETQDAIYSNAGQLVETTTTDYEPIAQESTVPVVYYTLQLPIRHTVIWPNGMESKHETDYDMAVQFVVSSGYTLVNGPTGSYGRMIATRDYDYAQGQPGGLIRSTATAYQWQNSPAYLAANLLNLASSSTITSPSSTSNPVAQTTYNYDENNGSPQGAFGNLTSVVSLLSEGTNPKQQTIYNSQGLPYQTIDPRGATTTYSYDSTGAFLSEIQYPSTGSVQHTEHYAFDKNTGLIDSHTDQNGNKTNYSYTDPNSGVADPLNRLRQVILPQTSVGGVAASGGTTYSYDDTPGSLALSATTLITGSASETNITSYDGLGRVIHTELQSDPGGADYTDTTYDAMGRVATVSNPYRSTSDTTYGLTYYSYDALNRPTLQVQPDNTSITWSYSGNTVTFTDEVGNQWKRTGDALGRLTQVLEPSPTSPRPPLATNYTYNALGDLLTVNQIGASGETARARSFTYDSLSRLVTATNPETGTICYGKWSSGTGGTCGGGYDANGNLLYKSTPAPNAPAGSVAAVTVTTNTYDTLNRLLSSSHSDHTPEEIFTYDNGAAGTNSIGHVTFESLTDPTGKILAQRSYTQFDPMGRLQKESQCVLPNCPGIQYSPSYTYDLAGNVLTAYNGISAQPITLTYSYDGANHLQMISSSLSDANRPAILFQAIASSSQPTYTAAGALAYAQYGYTAAKTAVALTRSYDRRNRVTQQNARSGSTSLYNFTIPSGGYAANGNLLAVNDSVGLDWTFKYDDLNRLSAANGAGSIAGQSLNYTYDSFGNRKTQSITGADFQQYAASASYNNNNQATSTNLTAAVGYDQAGNITNDGVNTYAIDAESRICAYHESVLNENWTNVYDAEGHRVAKGEVPSGSSCFTGTGFVPTETDVLGQGGEQFSTLNSSGWVRTNVYANDQILATYEGSSLYFALNDWLGTKRVVTNGTGTVQDTFQSFWFGDAFHANGSTDPSDHHYTGQLHDSQSGLDYFGARFYAGNMGRFLSPDPVGGSLSNPQSLNRYAYVLNNPLGFIDPTGLDTCVNGDGSLGDDGSATTNLRFPVPPCPQSQLDSAAAAAGLSGSSGRDFASIGLSGGGDVTSSGGYGNSDSGDWVDPGQLAYYTFGAPSAGTWTSSYNAVKTAGAATGLAYGGAFFAPEIAGGLSAAGQWGANASGALGPATSRIFWSGVGYFGAQRAAQLEEGSTLESSFLGTTIENVQQALNLSYSTTKPVWDWASAAFARGAQGAVTLYPGLNGYTGQTWNNIESVILNARNIPITTIPF